MISKLTEEQRAEIRNARGAEVDSRDSRKRKREERKRLRAKAAMHGLGRDGKQKQFSRGVKKPTPRRQARHYGITFALEPGDLAATSRELWLATVTCDDDRSSSMIRRTIPAGSLVIIDSLCGTTSAYDRNHCRIFFEGLVWDRCPVATLRPLSEDDDEDDEE
jgi:hypothetical protein